MYIFGLKCCYCSHALESLGIENGVLSTKCSSCGHVSRPKQKDLSKNTVYSKFANKTVEVQYSAKHSKSGEHRRASTINSNEVYPDRKRFR
jgi:transcription elongation factor Elf1